MLWIEKPYTKVACISDPHAHLATFEALVSKIPPDYQIIVLGDLIDKGKKARELVELIKTKYEALLGNHDNFMTVETNPRYWKQWTSLWISNNGRDTMKSYGDKWRIQNVEEHKKTFREHIVYFKNLPLVIELPNLMVKGKPVILSHSTISRAVNHYGSIARLKEVLQTGKRQEFLANYAREESTTEDAIIQSIMWEQVNEVDKLPDLGIFNVVGHTVQDNGVQIGNNGAAIDCGVYKNYKMSALLLPELTIIEQEALPEI